MRILLTLTLILTASIAYAYNPAGPVAKAVATATIPSAVVVVVEEASCAYDPDWSTWDGTNDGELVESLLGDGEWNTGEFSQVSEDTSLHVYASRADSGSNYKLYSAIVTVDPCDKTLDLGTPTELDDTGTVFGLPVLTKLSTTRYLAFQDFAGASPTATFYLLDETGTQVDSQTMTATVFNGSGNCNLTAHSATIAVLACRRESDSDGGLVAIDVASDNIVVGTDVEYLDAVTVINPDVVALTATRGLVTGTTDVHRYTLSGTEITVGTSVDIQASGTAIKFNANAIKIATDTALFSFIDSANDVHISVITDDGSTLARADDAVVYAGTAGGWSADALTEVQPFISGTQDGIYLHVDQVSTTQAQVFSFTWDGSDIVDGDDVVVATGADSGVEHATLHQFENGAVVMVYQDSVLWDWMVLTP